MLHRNCSTGGIANTRNRMLLNNILGSGGLKAISLVASLLLVPVTIHYLDNELYGIWLTISSMLFWINTFDLGLGNGMRNYLAEALARGDYRTGRTYISTTFVLLSLVAGTMAVLLAIPLGTLNFNRVFNTQLVEAQTLRNALAVAVLFTLANFVLKNVGLVFVAMQRYALNDLLNTLGGMMSLCAIFLLTKLTSPGHLCYVVLAYTATFTLIYLCAAIPLFKKYPQLKPSWQSMDWNIGKRVVGKGIGFFIIQATSCLVIFGAANFFITQYCGPSEVTTYNIAYKYFAMLITAYTIIISPMWNAYTDAYVKGDYLWIRKTLIHAMKFWLLSTMVGIVMLCLSAYFYRLWVGKTVDVPFSVSLCVLIYVSLFNLNNGLTYLINGLNKIRVQMATSVLATLLYISAILLFGKQWKTEGIVICMAVAYACMCAVHSYQCYLLVSRKAKGIWNK